MVATEKLDEAFQRFEQALAQFETVILRKAEDQKRMESLEGEAETHAIGT
jgi:hypothetical protein